MKNKLYIVALIIALTVLSSCAKKKIDLLKISSDVPAAVVIQEQARLAEAAAPEVQPHTEVIVNKAEEIKVNDAAQMKNIEVLKTELNKERDNSTVLLRKIFALGIALSAAALAISIALFLLGHLRSLTVTMIAVACLATCITMQIAITYMLYIALGCGLILVGIVGYMAFKHKSAVKEIVNTVEAIKENKPNFKELANSIQSAYTQKIVKKTKGE